MPARCSSPRNTRSMRIVASSTVVARWCVAEPPGASNTTSPIAAWSNSTSPWSRSCTTVVPGRIRKTIAPSRSCAAPLAKSPSTCRRYMSPRSDRRYGPAAPPMSGPSSQPRPSQRRSRTTAVSLACSSRGATSSMRRTKRPPDRRAINQLKSAARAAPTDSVAAGAGAKRTRNGRSTPSAPIRLVTEHRGAASGRRRPAAA